MQACAAIESAIGSSPMARFKPTMDYCANTLLPLMDTLGHPWTAWRRWFDRLRFWPLPTYQERCFSADSYSASAL